MLKLRCVLLVAIILGAGSASQAQDESKALFNVGGGIGFPQGDLSTFINSGGHAVIGAGYAFSRVVGLDTEFMWHALPVNTKTKDFLQTPGASARQYSVTLNPIVRFTEKPLITVVAHRSGIVLANAGIDTSNVAGDDQHVLLLPEDCNRSCREIRAQLAARTGVEAGVLIIDSLGRAWRNGTVGVALGAAGLPALLDLRGTPDLFGRALRSTEVGIADEIAAAASHADGPGRRRHAGRAAARPRPCPAPRIRPPI